MLSKWLALQARESSYKFEVVDIIELSDPDEEILECLAHQLVIAHGSPQMIREELIEDIAENQDIKLDIIKRYLEENVLPGKIITQVGNFGEILAASILVEFENFWFPIYKLRFREKKDWSPRLTDLCLIKRHDLSRPLICYGEVKTKSSDCDKELGIKGHNSLAKDDALSNDEILSFMSKVLYETSRVEEARFLSGLRRRKISYDKRHDLFLVHRKDKWTDEILDKLEVHELDERLVNFSVKVVLISSLRDVIDAAYKQCTVSTAKMMDSMDKHEYREDTYSDLETLMADQKFQTDLAQVRAKSIQMELLREQPRTRFTFDEKTIWQSCNYIFSESSLLLREGYENETSEKKTLLEWSKTAAQSFEFLAKTAKEEDKEILLLNSAMCYHISGYHANAQCIARSIEEEYLSRVQIDQREFPDAFLTLQFRRTLVNFLKRDVAGLQKQSRQSLADIYGFQEEIAIKMVKDASSINEAFNLTASAFFQQAIADFVQHCLNGDPEHLAKARENIQKSYKYFQQARDVRLGVLVSELRTLFSLFEEHGTWLNVSRYAESLVKHPVWQTYLRNLAFEKSIVEFWPSQLKALQNGLLSAEKSFIVQMPTSAGKTFIAELSILASLTQKERQRCLYIAPYRALVNEIESKLADTLGAVGYRVSNLTGGFEFDAFQNFLLAESDVLVATPEKVELLFRTHSEYFDSVSTIVIDEGHILDEGIPSTSELDIGKTLSERLKENGTLGRGTLLELLITRLKRKLPQARFLFLSAVMPEINADDFVSWLSESRQEPLRVDRSERPSRQTIAMFKWLPSSNNGKLEFVDLPTLPDGRHMFVPFFLQRETYLTGEKTPTGRDQQKTWPAIGNKAQSTAMLAIKFAEAGPVLVFCTFPNETKIIIDNIITSLEYLEASNKPFSEKLKYIEKPTLESFDLALEWLGEDHPLTKGLHYGVGLHYGPLPDPIRQAIESEFRSEQIQILVSTNTLGQGVNMPIKTAIIYSLEGRYGKEPDQKLEVKKRDFWNICGRAGRATKETEGQIIFVVSSDNDEFLLNTYKNETNVEEIESSLYKLLQSLIEKRISQDELIGYLDSHVLALLVEEVVDTQDEDAIKDFLGMSLVGIQARRNGVDLSPLVAAIKKVAAWVSENVADVNLRKVFASTGLRVESCQSLERAADFFVASLTPEILENEKGSFYLNESLLEAAFRACQDLPEMRLKRTMYGGPEDEFELVSAWVTGKSIRELRSTYWSQTSKTDFGAYIVDRIDYKLPWGFNGFLRVLAFKLQMKYEDLPISWLYLPSMMKFGVNSVLACLVHSFGVSSRKLALKLAELYESAKGLMISDFVKWIVNLPTEFILQELEGSIFEKRKLLDKLNHVIADDDLLKFILLVQKEFESSVKGIAYNNRKIVAHNVKEKDSLILELEPENPDDPFAIRVMFEGSHIGYVQRDRAKIITREMQQGKVFHAYAKKVRPPTESNPYPQIEMTIRRDY